MYTYKTRVFLHHTDAAGRLFFANQFYFMHEAKEKLLETLDLSIEKMLNDSELTYPLVHAEADYKAMLVAGDLITVNIGVEKIGETSVTFAYTIHKDDGTLAGTGKTVSVCVNKKTNMKVPLPKSWREKFTKALIKPV